MTNYRDRSGPTKCRVCLKEKIRNRAEFYLNPKKQYVYRDERGRRWNKRCCPDCVPADLRRLGKRKKRSELTDAKNKKGYLSERAVMEHFSKQGFMVEQTQAHGPDLTLTKDDRKLTCEVKSVTASWIAGKPFYFTSPVYPNRRNDDLIAIVMPNGSILVESMESHLKQCSSSGARRFTAEARAMGF